MNAAFWINPTGKIHRVGKNHISDVIKYPRKFGLSQSEIRKVFDKHNEPYGHEGHAREEILKNLFKDNFIRIRKYKNLGYTVNVKKLAGKAKIYVYEWVEKLLGTGIDGEKDYTTTPVHFDAADKRYSPTTLGDIQKDISVMESNQHELVECHVSQWENVKLKKFKEFINENL